MESGAPCIASMPVHIPAQIAHDGIGFIMQGSKLSVLIFIFVVFEGDACHNLFVSTTRQDGTAVCDGATLLLIRERPTPRRGRRARGKNEAIAFPQEKKNTSVLFPRKKI
jgi:hypothetical protein